MKLRFAVLALAAASLGVSASHGQTTLSVGDIQVTGVTSDANDSFSFVLWKSVEANTVIRFTDNSFTSTAGNGFVSGSEEDMSITFSSAVPAGSVIRYEDTTGLVLPSGVTATFSGSLSGTSADGDQVFAYQGNGVSGSNFSGRTLLYGFNIANTSWLSSGSADSQNSYRPAAVSGLDANIDSGNFDNADYTGTRIGMTTAAYRAAVANVDNLTQSNTRANLLTAGFTSGSSISLHWDADGKASAANGGAGSWDATTQSRFKNGAAGTTYLHWVNSSTGNDHTAVFGGTAGTVTVSGDVTAGGLRFDTTGYTLTGSTITLSSSTTPMIDTGAVAATINSELAGTQGLTKTGSGALTLGGNNSYNGDTTISEGKLVVTDTIGNSAVTVSGSGAILATDTAATIGSMLTIRNGAILAVGDAANASTATAMVTGATTFNNGSIFSWDISSGGTSYDKLISSGMAGEATAGDAVFRIVAADATFSNTFWDTNRTWADIFTTNGSAAIANWAGVFGSDVSVVNSSFTPITPVGGSFSVSGNTLTWTAVPEPAGSLAGLLITAGLLRRRRLAP